MRFRHLAYPIVLGSVALILLALPQAGATTYIPGDLVIGGSDVRENDTVLVDGSVFVGPAGDVLWSNITLLFNSSGPTPRGLYIDGTVAFTGVTVAAAPGKDAWWFRINSTAHFEAQGSDFSQMNGSASDPGASGTVLSTDFASVVGGIQIYSDDTHIGNSSVHDGLGTNIYVSGASPRIDGNRIFDVRYLPFEYSTSYAAPRQTSDYRAVAVCIVLASGQADVSGNRVERCGALASANATDPGSSGATEATSNLRLVGAGVVVLSGLPTMRQDAVLDMATVTPSPRAFAWGGVNVTQNFFKVASWGVLFKNAAGATMSGGSIGGADTALEILDNAGYAGGAIFFDLFSLNLNGTYNAGLLANFGGLTQQVTLTVDTFTFGPAQQAAAAIRFTGMTAAHTVTVTNSQLDQNSAATGITVEDQASSGQPTFTVSHSRFSRLVAPVSLHLQGLTGGAIVKVHNNTMNNTAGVYNGSATPYYRGGIDLRWVSLTGGTLSLVIEDNKVYNQSWQLGGTENAGFTAWSQLASGLTGVYSIQRNIFSNVSYGVHFYDYYGANAQSTSWSIRHNTVQNATSYGMYIYSYSTGGGNIDPGFDWNFFDHASSYALYWYLYGGNVAQRAFTNNTVYGYSTTSSYGLYLAFGAAANKWAFSIWDTVVFNASTGFTFVQVLANVYRSDVSNTGTGVVCSDCVARLEDTAIYPLSATASGTTAEVTLYQRVGSPRVQWQGDGGMLATSGNLYLRWMGGSSPITLATVPLDPTATVLNRSIPGWRKTQVLADRYENLTPFTAIPVGLTSYEVAGLIIPFGQPFFGNITLVDPELPSVTVTTPGAGTQVRARAVVVKGAVSDLTTGVEVVQISGDGVNFVNVTTYDPMAQTWEHTLAFPADGVYKIFLHAWDRARWNITFGNYSTGFRELNISGIVIDTVSPRLVLVDPGADLTTRFTLYTVRGQATDENGIDSFVFSFNGVQVPVTRSPTGGFDVPLSNFKEGPNLITVVATDFAGNTNVLTRTIILDTTPPHLIVTSPLNNSYTNRAGIEVTGELESDVVLYINNIPHSFPFTFPLKQGPNNIWINATDRGGNTVSELRVVELDLTPPTIAFAQPSRFPFATRDPHVVIQVRASEPIALLLVNNVSYPLPADPPRNFTFELYLEDGTHAVLVHVTDRANNSMEANAGPIIVDTVPPSLRVDSPADRTVQISRNVNIRGRTDANAWVNVTTPGGRFPATDFNPITGEFGYPDTRISDGVILYLIEATDAVGNTVAVSVQLQVDSTPPTVEVLGLQGEQVTQAEVMNFHGTVSPGTTLTLTVQSTDPTLSVSGRPVALACSALQGADCTFNFNLKVAQGLSTVSLLATDQAGNQAPREIHVKREVAAAAVDTGSSSLVPVLALAGLAIGLAFIPFWSRRLQGAAQAANPGLALRPEEDPQAQPAAPAPQQHVEATPHDMYAQDAMMRRPRAPRPPYGGS